MKLLFFTDVQYRGDNPRSRVDNYRESIKLKIRQIGSICREEGVDCLVLGGDLVDSPKSRFGVVTELAFLLRDIDVPFKFAVAGNHDLKGVTYQNSPLPLVFWVSGFQLLDRIPVEIPGFGGIYILGESYQGEVSNIGCLQANFVEGAYNICVLHSMTVPTPFYESYLLISDILEIPHSVYLVGHYHPGFGTVARDSDVFVSPGAIARKTSLESDIKRIPKVALLTLTDSGLSIAYRQLEVIPADQVFDLRVIQETKDLQDQTEMFIQSLERVRGDWGFDIEKEAMSRGRELSLPEHVIEEAVQLLRECRDGKDC